MRHPLLNSESKHYSVDGKEAIFKVEDELTIGELIGACKFNIMKYKLRQDHKGQKESDLKKIKTYESYLSFLKPYEIHPNMIASHVYKVYGITFDLEG